jgi:hypothetical protein
LTLPRARVKGNPLPKAKGKSLDLVIKEKEKVSLSKQKIGHITENVRLLSQDWAHY